MQKRGLVFKTSPRFFYSGTVFHSLVGLPLTSKPCSEDKSSRQVEVRGGSWSRYNLRHAIGLGLLPRSDASRLRTGVSGVVRTKRSCRRLKKLTRSSLGFGSLVSGQLVRTTQIGQISGAQTAADCFEMKSQILAESISEATRYKRPPDRSGGATESILTPDLAEALIPLISLRKQQRQAGNQAFIITQRLLNHRAA